MNLFNRLFFTMLLIVGLPAISMAEFIAVLETVENPKGLLTQSEKLYITNVLRELALQELPAEQNYTIMTRENINAMLPPGKSLEDCEGNCAVETGRNISADFVAQAVVGKFGEELTINVELYETAGNKLVASANGRSENIQGLATVINEKAPALFQKAKRAKPETPIVAPAPTTVEERAPTAIAPESKNVAESEPAYEPETSAESDNSAMPDTINLDMDSALPDRPRFRHGPWFHFGQFHDDDGLMDMGQSYEIGYAISLALTKRFDFLTGVSFEHMTADEDVLTTHYGPDGEYEYTSTENGYSYGITIPLELKLRWKASSSVWYSLGYKFRLPSFAEKMFTEPNDITAGIGISIAKIEIGFTIQLPSDHGYFDNYINTQMGLTLNYWIR